MNVRHYGLAYGPCGHIPLCRVMEGHTTQEWPLVTCGYCLQRKGRTARKPRMFPHRPAHIFSPGERVEFVQYTWAVDGGLDVDVGPVWRNHTLEKMEADGVITNVIRGYVTFKEPRQ